MKTFWQNIRGVRMIALSTMVVILMALAAFSITGYISGNNTFAVAVAIGVVADAIVAIGVGAAIVGIAAAVAEECKVKIRFCLYIFAAEGFLMVLAMTIWSAYLPLIIAALAVGVSLLLAEAKLRLWLANNRPLPIQYHEVKTMVGEGPHRSAEVVVSVEPVTLPLYSRLHRRLYRAYQPYNY